MLLISENPVLLAISCRHQRVSSVSFMQPVCVVDPLTPRDDTVRIIVLFSGVSVTCNDWI